MKLFLKIVSITFFSFLGLAGMSYGQYNPIIVSHINKHIDKKTIEKFLLLKEIEGQNCVPYDVNNLLAPLLHPLLPLLGELKTTEEGNHQFIQVHLSGLDKGQEAWLEVDAGLIWISAAMDDNGNVLKTNFEGAEGYCKKKSKAMGLKDENSVKRPEKKDYERLSDKFKVLKKYKAQILPNFVGYWFWSGSVLVDYSASAYNFFGGYGNIGSGHRDDPSGRVMCVLPVASLR